MQTRSVPRPAARLVPFRLPRWIRPESRRRPARRRLRALAFVAIALAAAAAVAAASLAGPRAPVPAETVLPVKPPGMGPFDFHYWR